MSDWNINGDWKIRLNLSTLSLDVIAQDIEICGAKSRTAFLNSVFLGYYPQARASVSSWRDAQAQQLRDRMQPLPQVWREKAVEALLSPEIAPPEPEKGHCPFLHNLSEPVVTALQSNTRDTAYYKNTAAYFRAVVEEYCRLPQYQREAILYADRLAQIEKAIRTQCQLEVTNSGGTVFKVHPVRVLPDLHGSYNYLVCYAREARQPLSEKRQCSFRINQLKNIRCTAEKAFLSEADRNRLEKAIRGQGVQFLTGDCINVQVRLTEKGEKKLRRHLTMRPTQQGAPQGDIYTFRCTFTQAEYYFTKLGADAQVLSPASLRKKFARTYGAAANMYKEEL